MPPVQSKLARVNNPSLLESLKYLPRNDIDQLSIVNRRFNNALAESYFQSTPLRVLDTELFADEDMCTFVVPSSLLDSYPPLFRNNDASAVKNVADQLRSSKFCIRHEALRDNWTRFTTNAESLAILLQQTPWLRFRRTDLRGLEETSIIKFAAIQQLWEGCELSIRKSQGDIAPLVGKCRQLAVGEYVSLSLAVRQSAGTLCNSLVLKYSLHGLTLETLVTDYLIPGGSWNGEKKRLHLKLFDPRTSGFTPDELIDAVKERFLAIDHPNSFEVELTSRSIDQHLQERDEVQTIEHRLQQSEGIGSCVITIKINAPLRFYHVQIGIVHD